MIPTKKCGANREIEPPRVIETEGMGVMVPKEVDGVKKVNFGPEFALENGDVYKSRVSPRR